MVNLFRRLAFINITPIVLLHLIILLLLYIINSLNSETLSNYFERIILVLNITIVPLYLFYINYNHRLKNTSYSLIYNILFMWLSAITGIVMYYENNYLTNSFSFPDPVAVLAFFYYAGFNLVIILVISLIFSYVSLKSKNLIK